MNGDDLEFNRRAVRPFDCLRDGWGLIKDDYWLFLGICVVGILAGSWAPFGVLMGPAMCGIYLCLLRQAQGLPISFDMLFKGFDYFLPSFIATLIMHGSMFLLMLPTFALVAVAFVVLAASHQNGEAPERIKSLVIFAIIGVYMLALFAALTVVGALFFFTFPLIVDRKLSGWEAVKLSFRAAFGNLGGILGLTVLNGLLSLAGVLACYIGVFFVLPVALAANAVAYRQVFPSEEDRPDFPA